jgi:quinoprotein glucose dehydrogenase
MSSHPNRRPGSQRAGRFVALAGLFAFAGCGPSGAPVSAPAGSAVYSPPVPVSALQGEILRVDAVTADSVAARIRSEVSIEIAPDLEIQLWASERLVEDPVALAIDNHGQVFVTYSARSGMLLDIRRHPDWRIPALTMRDTVQFQRFFREYMAPERSAENEWLPDLNEDGVRDWRDLTVQTERLYRVLDTTGDGHADLAQQMYEGFNSEISDIAGALLVRDGDIYVGAAPDWVRLRDTTGDGLIDSTEVLSSGYGTSPGFFGHGMSGAVNGPDGRIWWTIGDMGFNVVDKEGQRWEHPFEGAVFRSEPDGTGMEVFALGLRNSHEIAFDEYGNLVSVDNDGDHQGEIERIVYIVEGSDAGWRVNWQFGKYTDPNNNDYHVWMQERLFQPRHEGQAAYIVPPVANYNVGPAGVAYNPGTALNERWRNHFFVSAFHGSPTSSRIHAFQLRPSGAGMELASDTVIVRGTLTTGLEFGPDGALYAADWIQGWGSKGAGRIFRIDAPDAADSPIRRETQVLLAENFSGRSARDLSALLRHADMRVRTKAQHELANRGDARTLQAAARQRGHQLARIHAIWGIGQLARRDGRQAEPLTALLRDGDPEIRAQAAKTLGDVRYAQANDAMVALLRDESPRARFFAAQALGRTKHAAAVQPLVAMLADNEERDVYLRHAGAYALAQIGDAAAVTALADHPSRGVRIAAVVALRRMKDPGVARFLADADEYIVTEAARAINDDGGIPDALAELGRVLEQPRFSDQALLRRAVNANHRVGTVEAAQRVANFSRRTQAAPPLRVEALASLGVWPQPSLVDRVDGHYLGPVQRDTAIARTAVVGLIEPLLRDPSADVRVAVAQAAGRLRVAEGAPALLAALRADASPRVRVAALQALNAVGGQGAEPVRVALADRDQTVRMAALALVPELGLSDDDAADLLAAVVGRGAAEEQQSAIAALGELRSERARQVLGQQLQQLETGQLAPEVQLDVIEAVEASQAPALQQRLQRYQAAKPAGNAVEQFREAMHGGDAIRGRQIALQDPGAQCTRCHTIGQVGSDVGPPLIGVGDRLTRHQLLEALVDPNARVAPGYGTVMLTLRSGETLNGVLRDETDTHLVLATVTGESRQIPKAEVAQRTNAPSAMPPMQFFLGPRELRDVVEYMASLRAGQAPGSE